MIRSLLQVEAACMSAGRIGMIQGALLTSLVLAAIGCGRSGSAAGAMRATIAAADLVPLADDSLLVEPRDVAFTGGHILVLNSAAPFIAEYGSDGALIRRFGAAGQGPGELQLPVAITTTAEDEVDLLDAGRRSIVRFKADRTVLPDLSLTSVVQAVAGRSLAWMYGRPGELRATAGGWLYYHAPRVIGQTGDLNAGQLLHLRLDDTAIDTVLDLGARAAELATQLDGRLENRELVPVPLWDACGDGTFVLFDPVDTTVSLRTLTGSIRWADTLRWTSSPLGDPQYLRAIAFQLRSMLRGRGTMTDAQVDETSALALQTRRSVFGTRSPLAFDLLCDESHRIFVGRFSTEDHPLGFGRTWVELDSAGGERELVFPAGFRLMGIGQGWGVGSVADSTGAIRMVRVRLPAASVAGH